MVRKSMITVSIVAAVFALSGCGGSPTDGTKVTSTTTKPTAHLKADTPQELIENKKKAFESFKNSSLFKTDSQKGTKLVEKTGQSLIEDLQKDGAGERIEKQTGDTLDPCIKITGTSSDHAIDKTVKFDKCDLGNGASLNGTISVKAEDKTVSGTETGNASISISSLNLKKDNNNEILISTAELSSDWTIKEEENSSSAKGSASAGITAYLKSDGKKILIFDGLNGKATLELKQQEVTEQNDAGGTHTYNKTIKEAYTGSIDGYIGDEDGMLKVETPKTIKGDTVKIKHCPAEGEITLTDANGKKAVFSADGKSITLTYNEQSKTLEECTSK